MPDWMVINCIYNGLGPQSRPMLDAASGGALWAKSYDEAYELIEMMAANEYQNPTQRLHQGKAVGILDVDATSAIAAQLKALTMKVTKEKESATEQNKEESDQQVETPVLSSKSDSGKTVVEADKNKINEEASKESAEKSSPKADIGVKRVYPPPPFPKRLQKHKLDKQFAKFLEGFKKLQINIPFAEALEQMPSYAKFMKGILSRKLKLEELETVALTEECSALKPTNMSLQLADRSITYPRGIVEDVLVKVDNPIFPADFVILDFEEDKKIPIILGRPFLATGRTLIDVQKGELTMRVQD
ncbi:uncharacterized protein LOC135152134 [Daucus carota subsp. sativus]|uniref:uncharacterized protein LOC135152134 n=1 Tax=Daucus carota subsp. sativus TaxID=79200 RepID=UPI003082DA0E